MTERLSNSEWPSQCVPAGLLAYTPPRPSCLPSLVNRINGKAWIEPSPASSIHATVICLSFASIVVTLYPQGAPLSFLSLKRQPSARRFNSRYVVIQPSVPFVILACPSTADLLGGPCCVTMYRAFCTLAKPQQSYRHLHVEHTGDGCHQVTCITDFLYLASSRVPLVRPASSRSLTPCVASGLYWPLRASQSRRTMIQSRFKASMGSQNQRHRLR
jgi:hypothetical protein